MCGTPLAIGLGIGLYIFTLTHLVMAGFSFDQENQEHNSRLMGYDNTQGYWFTDNQPFDYTTLVWKVLTLHGNEHSNSVWLIMT